MKRRIHIVSFKHAWEGIVYAFTSQPNFQVHTVAAMAVVWLGRYFQVARNEWFILAFAIVLVFVAEMLNTAVEAMTDLLHRDENIIAKHSKDVAAGMVLIAVAGSVIVGLVIFLPYIWN